MIPGVEGTRLNGLPTSPPILVETSFMDVAVEMRQSVTGQQEVWAHVETLPAFEIALLGHNPKGELTLILMEKRRLATDEPKVKVPGGYLVPGRSMQQKILADTGISINENGLIGTGHVIGHSEIKTPITLYYLPPEGWEKTNEPREGVRVFAATLENAAKMAMGHEVENDSSFSLIMRLYWLWRERLLLCD